MFFPLLMLFTFSYSVVILLHWYGWTKKIRSANQNKLEEGISVLVSFRNEATNLPACLQSLKELNCGSFPHEFIFVDDHSEDASVEVFHKAQLSNAKLLQLTDNTGKKAAITKGVEEAKFAYVITLDADSTVSSAWLQSMLMSASKGEFKAMGGLVKFKENASFLNKFLNIEMCSLMGITAGGINAGFPVLANGTNFLFRKDAFVAVGGYSGDHFSSGDDVFLLQKIAKKFGAKSVGFNSELEALVSTQAPANLRELLQQRVRWAGKSKGYRLFAKMLTAFIGFYNILMALMILSALFFPYLLPFVLAMFICKMMADAVLTVPVLSRTQQQKLLPYIPLIALIYPFYILLTVLVGLFLKAEWKGRAVK